MTNLRDPLTARRPPGALHDAPVPGRRPSRVSHLVRMMDDAPEETVRPLPSTGLRTVSEVRSTLLASSLQAVRARGLFDRYAEALPSEFHHEVLHTLAPVWLPLRTAMAHYQAMQSLQLPDDEVLNIGRSVGDRLHGSFLGTLARGARHAGVTPWTIAGKLDMIWSRVFRGGAIGVFKVGPKDARVALRGIPLAEIPYFRIGWQGVLAGGIEAIVKKCYVREPRRAHEKHGLDVFVYWA